MNTTNMLAIMAALLLTPGCPDADPQAGSTSDTADTSGDEGTDTTPDIVPDAGSDAPTSLDIGTDGGQDTTGDTTLDTSPDSGADADAGLDIADAPDAPDASLGCQPAQCDDGNPCNGVEFCDVHGLCSAGVAPSCEGSCLSGVCVPNIGCEVASPGVDCAAPLAWAKSLLLWQGKPEVLRDAIQSELVEVNCGWACNYSDAAPIACTVSEEAGTQQCSHPTTCGATVTGTLTWDESQAEVCAEFTDFYERRLSVDDFSLEVANSPVLSLPNGSANRFTSSYYGGASYNWSTTLRIGRDGSPGVYPGWALPEATTYLECTGSGATYTGSTEYAQFFGPSRPRHETSGAATATLGLGGGGGQLSASWTMLWEAAWTDAELGTSGGCDLEPQGTLTLDVDGGDTDTLQHIITFEGAAGCDGCGSHTVDGVPQSALWCGELPTLHTIP